eukprot:TRINITY_DN55_c0_g1_i6.p1 TRINITY_DN55_c0_g1~~TRINITY_DN55_c0_g1_i6.p1  ORF type:complete len:608 (+),score=244.25 TRINITY_DN55_c0_g1_i6:88-1824(+)
MAAGAEHQSSSLYVGDLNGDVTEANLFDVFREIGPVLSIRVCRDAVTRRSLGYAYVNFQSPADAERAHDQLNFVKIKGRCCRIMWCRRDPSQRKSGQGNIFIKNLAPDIDNKALHDTFQAFGQILSCKVVTDQQGQSKGYGFVQFNTQSAADEAVSKVNNMLLNGSQVYVGKFERKEKKLRSLEHTFTNCYVKHFNKEATDQQVKDYFGTFGEISSCCVRRDDSGNSLGFAFVAYKEHEAAARAVKEANDAVGTPISIEGRKLYVARHQRKSEREHLRQLAQRDRAAQFAKYANLYIKNLDDTVTTAMLRESFAEFGEIVSAKVMTDRETRISRGFGFVCFRDTEHANKAVQSMNGRIFCGKPLYVALAQRKEQRRAQLELYYRSGRNPFTGGAGGPASQGPQGVTYGGYGQGPSRGGMGGMGGMTGRGGGKGASRGGRGPPMMQGPAQFGGRPQPMMQPMQMGPGPFMPMGGMQMPPAQMAPPRQAPVQRQANPSQAGIDPGKLTSMSPEQQKNYLGEKLFTKIQLQQPANAAKITGMLLEMDNSEIINLLESQQLLQNKVQEAVHVLEEHGGAGGN